ncbi:hypothetical protein [uncultured Tyzzerella sp.]|uniref:hypothetical protein n=1 Tax=uncultured Tyzzerella sp. TaxID=2321398 RepID=UPI002943393D|nr:hypothetical protein [uncultured Tyzzerella sp.]
MGKLNLKLNKLINQYLKNNKKLENVRFELKESEEIPGSIEILYIVNKDDTAETRKEIYNTISDIVYTDFEKKGLTKEEIMNVLISYDYFNEIRLLKDDKETSKDKNIFRNNLLDALYYQTYKLELSKILSSGKSFFKEEITNSNKYENKNLCNFFIEVNDSKNKDLFFLK